MIPEVDVARVEYIVDTSDVVNIVNDGFVRSNRGRPSNTRDLRLFIIGALLTNQTYGNFRTRAIHRTLTRDLSRATQERLGVITYRNGHETVLKETALNTVVRRIFEGLGYGNGTHPELDDDERARRLGVMNAASDALMEVFCAPFTSTHYAIDSSGIWSWAVSDRKPPGVDPDDTDAECHIISSADPDARWGVKTSKSGGKENVFGYHFSAAVMVPGRNADGKLHPSHYEPRLIRRIGITPAPHDIVDVTMSMIDRLEGSVTDISTDRAYHHKKIERFLIPLLERGIRNHHDLRSDEISTAHYEKVVFLGGQGFCSACPPELLDAKPLPPDPSPTAQAESDRKFNMRLPYHMKVIKPLDATLRITLQCPAAAGVMGCPNRPESMIIANRRALPTVKNPIAPNAKGELPRCCTSTTFQLRLPEPIAKLWQPYLWQSPRWQRFVWIRSFVESVYGNLKNEARENINRKVHRHIGITWSHFFLTLASTNYNLRTLRKWHEETGRGDPDHPLLADITPNKKRRAPVTRGPRTPRWKKAA